MVYSESMDSLYESQNHTILSKALMGIQNWECDYLLHPLIYYCGSQSHIESHTMKRFQLNHNKISLYFTLNWPVSFLSSSTSFFYSSSSSDFMCIFSTLHYSAVLFLPLPMTVRFYVYSSSVFASSYDSKQEMSIL